MKKTLSKDLGLYLVLIFLFICFSFVIPWINPSDKMEAGTYNAYTESLIRDGDFNVAKRLPKHIAWYTATTYNYPDTVSTGVAILWAPFFVYGHAVEKIFGKSGFSGYEAVDVAQMICSIFFTFSLMILVHKFLCHFYSKNLSSWISTGLFFGSGLFFYFLSVPTNNDITSAVLSALLIIFAFHLKESKETYFSWIYVGLLSGAMLTLKTTGGFFISIALGFTLINEKDKIRAFKTRAPWLFLGFLLIAVPYEINIFIQRGSFYDPKMLAIHPLFITNVLSSLLVGDRGYFIVSPVYIISFFYLCYHLNAYFRTKKIEADPLVFFLALLCWTKIVLSSFRFFTNEYFGPRMLLSEYLLFALITCDGLNLLIKKTRQKNHAQILLLGGFVLLCFWTFIEGMVKISTDEYFHELGLKALPQTVSDFNYKWSQIISECMTRDYHHILYFLPLIFILCHLLVKLIKGPGVLSQTFAGKIKLSAVLFAFCYFLSTALNVNNNAKNVARLKAQGYFKDMALVKGPFSYGYDNVISELDLEILLARRKNDQKSLEKFSRIKETYLNLIQKEIIFDPKGIFKRTGEEADSFWDRPNYLEEDSFLTRQDRLRESCRLK